jgi:hypothetical protein
MDVLKRTRKNMDSGSAVKNVKNETFFTSTIGLFVVHAAWASAAIPALLSLANGLIFSS